MRTHSKITRSSFHKRSFLLLEVLTSSFIAGIIIVACITLFTLFITQRGKEEARLIASQKRIQSASYLRWILMNIASKQNSLFVVEDGSEGSKRIICHINKKLDSNPNDASDMLAMFYLDKEKGLILVHRPFKVYKEHGFDTEKAFSIWPEAQEVTWKFLYKDPLKENDAQSKAEWKESWTKEDGIPLAIKACIVEKSPNEKKPEIVVTGIVLSQMKDATIHIR